MHNFRNFTNVANFVFGKGSFNQLGPILDQRRNSTSAFFIFFVDDVFKGEALEQKIPLQGQDTILWISAQEEPKISIVDQITQQIRDNFNTLPTGVIGIGGGTLMDYAKAISLTLTNPGSSKQYQGLDLIKNKGVWCVCIPTISGTGAEVSMTAVLSGPKRKLGIKSNYTVPDQIVLDAELTKSVPSHQRFYTGMDCYIHAVEALTGHCRNALGDAYGEKSLALCRDVFLNHENKYTPEVSEKLMIASYLGGLSLTYAQVGVCHALSYGLSHILKYPHGIANCICFNQLEDYYGDAVKTFRQMVEQHQIPLPQHITKALPEEKLVALAQVAYDLEHMWLHALGEDWKEKMSMEKLIELYARL